MASDIRQNIFPQTDEKSLGLFRQYAMEVDQLSARGAQLIILPEKIGLISDAALPELDAILGAAAARTRTYILVGLDHTYPGSKALNQARLFSPDGKVIASYDKHHLVPVFEDRDRPGTARTLLDQPSGRWGIQICKDMDFPRLSREYGKDNAALLLVPAWDFIDDDWLHDRMAVLRGVESGFTIVRSAKQGLLTVSDDRGRILAQRPSAAEQFSSIIAAAPVRHSATLYASWGDWFAGVSIALLAIVLAVPLGRATDVKVRAESAR